MKIKLLLTAFVSTFIIHTSAFAQGSLTPPSGAPTPVMKSLDQVEARKPIASVPYTISVPGSYYLTTNVTTAVSNAIVIAASGVTLDLNGFTISSTVANAANGGTAILLVGNLSDITLLNGHIRSGVTNSGTNTYSGPGFNQGISYVFSGGAPANVQVSGISVSGTLAGGIYMITGKNTRVESCTVNTTGLGMGIGATFVTHCSVRDCGGTAIWCEQAVDSRGEATLYGYGISAGSSAKGCVGSAIDNDAVNAVIAEDCKGVSVTGFGIFSTSAQNCFGTSSTGTGVYATTAHNCTGTSTSYYGLSATTALNCNGTSTSSVGLGATSAQNCYGTSSSGIGLSASTAQNSYGSSSSGTYGMTVIGTASFCRGYRPIGTAINAAIAIGCTSDGGNIVSPQKLLGTP